MQEVCKIYTKCERNFFFFRFKTIYLKTIHHVWIRSLKSSMKFTEFETKHTKTQIFFYQKTTKFPHLIFLY